MQTLYIVSEKTSSPLGFTIEPELTFYSREDAEKKLKELRLEAEEYKHLSFPEYDIFETTELLPYLLEYYDEFDALQFYGFYDTEQLEQIFDFFENVPDEHLIRSYLRQFHWVGEDAPAPILDRGAFINKQIAYMQSLIFDK